MSFWDWAWARHANEMSWYIRPLFLVPYCYFAYRRSIAGLLATILALATSMVWFPAPAQPDPRVLEFLQVEQRYLLAPWTPTKVLQTLTVPLTFGLLAVAFWQRRWWFGGAVLALAALGKVLWSVTAAEAAGRSVIPPALLGLVVCLFGVVLMRRSARSR